MQTNRRTLLAAGVAAAALPAPLRAAPAPDNATEALLARCAEEMLVDYPENATSLGVDTGARAALRGRVTDRSPAGQATCASHARARLAALRAVDAATLAPATRTDLAVAITAHERAVEGFAFPFGDVATLNGNNAYRNAPYVVAQNTGAFVELPDFLDTSHKVERAADAEAYLARLAGYAAALDGETERLKADSARGVIAPDFLLDKTLRNLRTARAEPIARWTVVESLRRRATFPGDWAARAERLTAERIAPALDRQIAELARQRTRATADAGVWKLPQGEDYYAWTLRASTTTRLSPDEVHAMGREQLADYQSQMDAILRTQGLTRGTVGERMTALGKDPRFLYPDNDEGRRQIIAYLGERLDDIRTRLPRAFATLVPAKLVVKRVPPAIENGAPDGYAGPGPMDGSLPGNFYINLRTTAIWPRYALPTLGYHEGIPGHVWQGEYAYKLPLIRSLIAFNAYSEGWALYAEQLAGELGVYDADPVARLGFLQSMAFRCCRLVVDTGLHAKRWTREQAVQWFATTNGSSAEEVGGEVDRYCAWPGQACGYKVGHSEINRLRDKTRAALGNRYDLRLFDDAVVLGGNVPLDVLERNIDAHITARKQA
jgi:uncharacterized protein (DUF885 family)